MKITKKEKEDDCDRKKKDGQKYCINICIFRKSWIIWSKRIKEFTWKCILHQEITSEFTQTLK